LFPVSCSGRMNYYILKQDQRILNQPMVMSCPKGIDPVEWIRGTVQPAPPSSMRFAMSPNSSKNRPAIISGILTFFHERFIELLNGLGVDNFQHFPVELKNPEGGIEHTYSVINVIGLLSAVDKSASVFTPMPTGGPGHLRSFKIDPAKAEGQRFFRLAEAP